MAKKTKSDPTGQRDNRKRATRALNARLKKARRESLTLFRNVPNKRSVVNQIVYGYDLNPEQAEILNNQFRRIVNQALDTAQETMPMNWWFQKHIEIPYRQGTLEGLNEFNRLISIADSQAMVGAGGVTATRLAPEVVLSSQKYMSELRNLYIDDYQVIKSLSDNTASQVIGEVNRGMKAGSPPSEIAKSIAGRYDVAESNAERIARTEVNRAYNDAKMRAIKTASEVSGFKAKVRHISALLPERTRKTHAARHYLVYTVEEQNAWWERDANRINCFIPGTIVQGRFSAGLKSFYRGKVIKLVTRRGCDLTVTPNHKIMTDRGLIAAAKIVKGDNLFTNLGEIKANMRVGNLNSHQIDSRIEKVFRSLSNIGRSFSVGIMGVNLNGDERFIDENIDGVFTKRPLVFAENIESLKLLDYLKLEFSSSSSISISSFFERLKRVLRTAPTLIRLFSYSVFVCLRFISISGYLRFFHASNLNTVFGYDSPNSPACDTVNFSKFEYGHPAPIALDDVITIQVSDFSGHVYDLQEESGLLIANNIIASNCLCHVRPILIGDDGNYIER